MQSMQSYVAGIIGTIGLRRHMLKPDHSEPNMSASLPPSIPSSFTHRRALIDRRCGVVCSGPLIGNSVLISATKDHWNQLMTAFQQREERMCGADG